MSRGESQLSAIWSPYRENVQSASIGYRSKEPEPDTPRRASVRVSQRRESSNPGSARSVIQDREIGGGHPTSLQRTAAESWVALPSFAAHFRLRALRPPQRMSQSAVERNRRDVPARFSTAPAGRQRRDVSSEGTICREPRPAGARSRSDVPGRNR